MKCVNRVFLSIVLCISFTFSVSAEVVYNPPLIDDIEYAEIYNSVISNLIVNYWDGEGSFNDKETGLWAGDWMGDSHFRGIDNLTLLAYDNRFLAGHSEADQVDTRHDILFKVNRTMDYTTFALNKFPAPPYGPFYPLRALMAMMRISQGEMYAAFSGGVGFAGGYEMASAPEYATYAPADYPVSLVRPSYRDQARDYADFIAAVMNYDGLVTFLTGQTQFSVEQVMSNCAWAMLRVADNDDSQSDRLDSIQKAMTFINNIGTDQHSEAVKAYFLLAELTGDDSYRDLAIERGQEIVQSAGGSSVLSRNLNKIDTFLTLYADDPRSEYLDGAHNLFEYIFENQLIDDPLNPGYKTVAHDNTRAQYVKDNTWPVPGWDENLIGTKYPACTGCVHVFCHLIHKYDALKNN